MRSDGSENAATLVEADLVDPGHRVQFYEHDEFLIDAVARFIGGGIGAGDAAIVIATWPHRDALEKRLAARGLDLDAARRTGRYVTLDAGETVAQLLVDDRPDAARFAEVVVRTIERAAEAHGGRVRAFGEMVALLWAAGNRDAALRLEALWNGAARTLPFSLLCAYPIAAFGQASDAEPFLEVCGAHAEVIPAESYSELASPDERRRIVTRLQQKARALETEVTQRLTIEDVLRERNQTLQAVFAASPLPIVVIDPDTTVRMWNPAAERVFGWSEQEVLGQPIPIVLPDKLGECADVRQAIVRGESFFGVETYRTRRDGSAIDLLISAAPLPGATGEPRAIVLLFEDVTERNRTEAVRQKTLCEAEAANRAKDEFLAMLGHELRNPLSTVRNAVVTAQLDPSRRDRALDIARRGVDQLGRLVDDLVDVARITRGRIVLRTQHLPFASIVERAVEATRPLVEERAHALTVSLPAFEVEVQGDPTRLEQVVANLISNAARYTNPGGRITVTVDHDGRDAVLRVRDNGPGISPAMLPRVFDLFAQADRSLDRAQGGLGIGLTVVKRLVELHGGRVEAHSDGIGTGAEFVVRLPGVQIAGTETTQANASIEVGQGCARVLLVEDNADAAESLTMLLEVLGHRVRVAPDGPAALDAARANAPDVMLVDIGLPGMDGYEVARRIRQHPALRRVVLVALTGYGRDEDRQHALAAGFDHHLVKPVEPAALEGLVSRLGRPDSEDPTLH